MDMNQIGKRINNVKKSLESIGKDYDAESVHNYFSIMEIGENHEKYLDEVTKSIESQRVAVKEDVQRQLDEIRNSSDPSLKKMLGEAEKNAKNILLKVEADCYSQIGAIGEMKKSFQSLYTDDILNKTLSSSSFKESMKNATIESGKKNISQMTQVYFEEEVIMSELPVVVDFYADWCGPCKGMEPAIEKLAEEYDGKIKFSKVNVDFEQGLALTYGVQGIPNLTVFKDGKPVKQIVGARPKDDLKNEIDGALGKSYKIDLSEKIQLKDDAHGNKDCGCDGPKEPEECGSDDCCKKGGKGCGDC